MRRRLFPGRAGWCGLARRALATGGVLGLAAVVALSAPAQAEIIDWRTVGGWRVAADTEMQGCFMDREFAEGLYLEFAFNGAAEVFFMFASNPTWESIDPDRRYDIWVYFGNETPWKFVGEHAAFGARDADNGNGGLDMVLPPDTDLLTVFFNELKQSTHVEIHYQGRSIARFSLSGSSAAADQLIRCQEALNAAPPSSDPFSGSTDPFGGAPNSADPFR